MRRLLLLWLAAVSLLVACGDASSGDQAFQRVEPPGGGTPAGRVAAPSQDVDATALVLAGVQAMLEHYYEPLDAGRLFSDAWDGADAALRQAGVAPVPPAPVFPSDAMAAAALHRDSFPTLEQAAAGRLGSAGLARAALHALAVRRDDPHTSYRSRELVARDQATRQGDSAVQLGAGFSRTVPPRVVRVPPDSPAERAGLRTGEVVVAVNGVPVSNGAEIPTLVDVRDGAPNTFTVKDAEGRTQQRVIVATRYVRPIEDHVVVDGRVGVIRLYGFPAMDQVVRRLREAVLEFEREGVRGWVLDLRDNGGGPIETVIAVAALFLDGGPLFEEQHRGRTLQSAAASGTALGVQRPLIALVGPGSFSGGEILPAVLQSRGRAIVVGERTGGGFGSSVSVPLPDGSALNVTTTEVVVGPEKQRLNRIGLSPDVVVARTAADIAAGRDPQLDAAIRLLTQEDS
jgi:carboxyl-terminal processing protease